MAERVWDRYLSESDRAHAAIDPAFRKGAGTRPALILVDLYRWVFGDEPEPLLKAVERWPNSCGLAGWNALPHIQRLLAGARAHVIPVFHVTGYDDLPNWRDARKGSPRTWDPEFAERFRRRHEIVDQVAPIAGELVIRKTAPSSFWGTPLAGLLVGLGVDTLIVAGESTSGCVRATVVDGKANRFKILVPEECVFDRHEAPHAINLFDIDQKYGDVVPLDEVLDYIADVAGVAVPVG